MLEKGKLEESYLEEEKLREGCWKREAGGRNGDEG